VWFNDKTQAPSVNLYIIYLPPQEFLEGKGAAIMKKKLLFGLMKLCLVWMGGVITASAVTNDASSVNNIKIVNNEFGVVIGRNRVIYPLDSRGVSLSVENTQEYPVLVQSKILNEDEKTTGKFIVTPPLFRLDSKQRNALRINQTSTDFPRDRETLQWLCVKGIPPSDSDLWREDDTKGKDTVKNNDGMTVEIQFSIDNCIKLLARPTQLKAKPAEFGQELKWNLRSGRLVAENPTPYYMNLGSVSYSGVKIRPHYIAPYSTWSFDLPKNLKQAGPVTWEVINDFGGLGKPLTQIPN